MEHFASGKAAPGLVDPENWTLGVVEGGYPGLCDVRLYGGVQAVSGVFVQALEKVPVRVECGRDRRVT